MGQVINDLLTPHGKEPPAMVLVALGESRFKNEPGIFPTLASKGKAWEFIRECYVREMIQRP